MVIVTTNLNEDATAADPGITSINDGGYSAGHIEVMPNGQTRCILVGTLDPQGAPPIPAGGSATFQITVGPLPDPVPQGMALILRFYRGQSTETDDLVVAGGVRRRFLGRR